MDTYIAQYRLVCLKVAKDTNVKNKYNLNQGA